MSSAIKIRSTTCMESPNDNETLQARIREVEDENQELRTQNLLQNRTITDLRNELVLLRIQMSELNDTSALLRERVRTLVQSAQQRQHQENEGNSGPVTAPPLMPPPPPPPPPLPSARIRISPRQVGAGEALTTPLGVSLSSPPRHRIKRDYRQGFYKTGRLPYRRIDGTEPGPSSQNQVFTPERPNYFVGLKIIPQFQSFLCSNSQSGFSDSASDSSGSDENLQVPKKCKLRPVDGESTTFKNSSHYSKDFELLKNVRNLHHQKVRQSILQNYNLVANNSKFFFPLPWDKKNSQSQTQPSTSGNEVRYFQGAASGTSDRVQMGSVGSRNPLKVSDCIQYTFPAIHEGLHNNGMNPVVGSPMPTSRLRKFKKNIPYLPQTCSNSSNEMMKSDESAKLDAEKHKKPADMDCRIDSESFSSTDDVRNVIARPLADLHSDFEQDGFQADESSNCLTSADNSLEKICISDSKTKRE